MDSSQKLQQRKKSCLFLGFIDIFSESKERLGLHASMILRFLHRNRISSTAIPYPVLEYFNNICMMRSSVLKDSLDRLLLKERGMSWFCFFLSSFPFQNDCVTTA